MLPIRSDIQIQEQDGVLRYSNESQITESDKKELIASDEFQKRISQCHDGKVFFNDIVFKADFISTFEVLIPKIDVPDKGTVLEMGSAHGWAGTLLKNEYPNSYVVISDLVADSLQFSYKYGNLLGIQVDERWAFNSRDIPFQEETFDRIFTFAAFHHFGDNGDYTNALEQMIRVLKPGGKILLLYEPYSPGYLYKFAFKRANRRKHIDGVDEDVLLAAKLKKIAEKNNCHFSVEFFPFYLHRSGVGNTLYYFLLSKLAGLQKILINCINVTIEKPT